MVKKCQWSENIQWTCWWCSVSVRLNQTNIFNIYLKSSSFNMAVMELIYHITLLKIQFSNLSLYLFPFQVAVNPSSCSRHQPRKPLSSPLMHITATRLIITKSIHTYTALTLKVLQLIGLGAILTLSTKLLQKLFLIPPKHIYYLFIIIKAAIFQLENHWVRPEAPGLD